MTSWQRLTPGEHYPLLPWEVIELIAKHLLELPPSVRSAEVENETICCRKTQWYNVQGFMAASPELHRMGFLRWITVLTIRVAADWVTALNFSHLVRELKCLDGAFTSEHRNVLAQFQRLCAVSIDSHRDVENGAAFAYRNIFSTLPRSLRRLEIMNAHGPDINVISTVTKCCPDLEELRLGRCTMFNRAPACRFWASFPFDHDSYISAEGIDAYTHSLGQELAPLRKLEALHLGVYLTPSNVVLSHRIFHSQKLLAPADIDWRQVVPPVDGNSVAENAAHFQNLVSLLHQIADADFSVDSCTFCREQSYAITKAAEQNANAILKAVIPSLQRVDWMSWFTPHHLGVSTHYYKA